MTRAAEAVDALTRTHTVAIPGTNNPVQYAQAHALLAQLRDLVTGATHGGGQGVSTSASRPPLNLRALDLLDEIERTVRDGWPGAGDPHARPATTEQKLQAWAAAAPTDAALTEQCCAWVDAIREAIAPEKRLEIMGECPECHCTHVENTDAETGRRTYTHALTAHTDPARVRCAVCGTTWEGQALHRLRATVVGPA